MDGDFSATWFHVSKGLNNFGYVPGIQKSDADHLPVSIVSEDDCCARWKKDASGFRYAVEESMESPKMQDRIESLYEETHFRSTNRTKAIGLSFARGILAEKKGYAVNWARYAALQFARCKKRNLQIHTFGPEHRHMRNRFRAQDFRFDTEKGCVVHDLVGSEDDWELNRAITIHDRAPNKRTSDTLETVSSTPLQLIKRPIYKANAGNNVSERPSVNQVPRVAIHQGHNHASFERDTHSQGAINRAWQFRVTEDDTHQQ
ncbi:hypothetical protein M758_UG199200 [Ceratodon purpureus]|nr:hypothetical protein M758_UG199200 [Ceratodon purpureus]